MTSLLFLRKAGRKLVVLLLVEVISRKATALLIIRKSLSVSRQEGGMR